ncbi:MAG TPA: 1-deoxy-D-xylulose-5-phosphate reductoisomerase [Acidobacteriota bacterium]|nr:1-deoxy-D-xylulose-5-phosphate reductoisomerase [Acidobacteriota bacterium]HRR25380.1 1-deoxy-D-xylulose-5-phosphate reductoisomerase [Acidobacteriota bacterium]HRR56858.1 1-deoxy-D-xylulose-5-phosphate reductoisomerase [Acidobacteriota bacterium]HRV08032.1 1-deoxy-D-xylulose-5-phosphate reductoisomerase [Acidobacteriota bacterium]
MKIGLAVLGSTGSIGRSALSLVDLYPERLEVVGLAARKNVDELSRQITRYRPRMAAIFEPEAAERLRRSFPDLAVSCGTEGLAEVACHPAADVVVAATAGAAGLIPTYRAVEEGKKIALANKETLVMAGDLLITRAQASNALIVPVDSEHTALHQCLRGADKREVKRLVLTASGGPFLGLTRRNLERVTVQEALTHPTWSMGRKITVDSATLMNKGLEVIEAHHLFGFSAEQIGVVVHPQSVIHSIVEFVDGSMLAQMGITDMRACLLYAIGYPERWEGRLPRLDLCSLPALTFQSPDSETFPCLQLAYEALTKGGTAPAILSAANEVAVELFLQGRLAFTSIPVLIEQTLVRCPVRPADSLEVILEADRVAREEAREIVRG